ncbi:hypothetical protein CH267_06505 [Rhodococcus sp. 06-621-2]|nr:MFS transporter [Rhodococcus sp. 06-621-2]OZC59746.1 hypothetical protein CH267_06505 [Rhodococcus sp. 06-621-2]
MSDNAPIGSRPARTGPSPVRVGAAALIGTTVEYYDFAIYSLAAALVFPTVFFTDNDPFIASILALGTFAVGFLARPLGGIFFGHYGDKIGRKKMLVISLLLMGITTVVIGLLPSYDSIGMAAPLLLVLLRFLQGFAFGGEWGGAILLAFEASPKSRRGLFAALPQTGPPAGILLGNIAFLTAAQLPDEQLYSWGWRIPFVVSAVLVVVGLAIRAGIAESAEFREMKAKNAVKQAPALTAFKKNRREILLVVGSFLGYGSLSLICINFLVSYGSGPDGAFTRSEMLTAVLISNVISLGMTPLSGHLADRFGFRKVMMTSVTGAIAGAVVLMTAINSGNYAFVIIGYVICLGGFFSLGNGAQGALFAGAFRPEVRYTGMSVGFQLSNVLGSAISPIVATILLRETGSIYSVAIYLAAVLAISAISVHFLIRRVAQLNTVTTAEDTPRRTDAANELRAPHA